MPRGPRLDAPGTWHHVIVRGIEKRKIVDSDKDREDFVARLGSIGPGYADIYLCLGADDPSRSYFTMQQQCRAADIHAPVSLSGVAQILRRSKGA